MEIIAAIVGAILTAILGLLVYIYRDSIKRWVTMNSPASSHALSLTDALGVEASLKRFLALERSKSGKEYFAIGGCIELVRSPNLKTGWVSNKMSFTIEEEPIVFKQGFRKLYDEWKRANPRNPDRVRFALASISGQNTTDNPLIHFKFKKTSFGKVFAIQNSLDKSIEIEPGVFGIPRQMFASSLLSPSISPIPNFLVFHIVVKTNDGYILFVQRAEDAHYYPEHWSASFEEQLSEEDFDKPNPFIAVVRRGLQEEFGISSKEEQVQIKLLSIFIEFENLLAVCCAVAIVPFNSGEIKNFWVEIAPDKREARRVEFIRSEIESLAKGLSSGVLSVDGKKISEGNWHPTTKYRLCLYCASEVGMNELRNMLIHIT